MSTTGQGSVVFSAKQDPPGSGPFAPTAARNGLSVDAGGKIVFGNDDDFAIGGSAALLNSRKLYLAGNIIDFIDDPFGTTRFVTIGAGSLSVDDTATGSHAGLGADATAGFMSVSAILPQIPFANFNNATPGTFNIVNQGNGMSVQDQLFAKTVMLLDIVNALYQMGDVSATGNNTLLNIDDGNNRINANLLGVNNALLLDLVSNSFSIGNPATNFLLLDGAAQRALIQVGSSDSLSLHVGLGTYGMGDLTGNFNGSNITVDDVNQVLLIGAANGITINGTPGFTGTKTPPVSITTVGGIVTNMT